MPENLCNKLNAYIDGELDLRGQMEVEAHLAACPDCQKELDELRQISTMLRASPEPKFTPVSAFRDQLMTRLPDRAEATPESAQPNTKLLPWMAPALVLAGWIFMQIALNLSTLVLLASEAGILNGATWTAGSPQQMQWFTVAQAGISGLLSLQVPAGLKMLNDANVFAQNLASLLLWQSMAALLFYGALALVWNRRVSVLQTQNASK